MQRVNIDGIIKKIKACVDRHNLGSYGDYSRWTWGERNLGRNEYGCADAANILYTIGAFPQSEAERRGFIEKMQKMQNPETGLWSESTHHPIHTTAHVSAALELFDARPRYKCTALKKYADVSGLIELLEKEVDWSRPWPQSHKGAGILVALENTDEIDLTWKDAYFNWMWEHTSPETGFIAFGEANPPLYESMAGGFHYFFNHEAEHRPMRYPEKVIDSCIELISRRDASILTSHCGFIEIDVVYCLSRAMRQSPHRFFEAKTVLESFADEYIKMIDGLDDKTDESFNDLHFLFGACCCLAELQSALPGKIVSSRPLRLVLDRRPFI